jgi:ribosomal protein L11 methylase PrmA
MGRARRHPASFRDPGGAVVYLDDRIFRTVNPVAAEDFSFVESSGLIEELVDRGWCTRADLVDPSLLGEIGKTATFVVEHEKIPFISYPYEWAFQTLKEAALRHLDIHLLALDHDVTLSDASAYNIQFVGPRAIFIDRLSFVRYHDGDIWVGHRQFCEQFLNPLLLRALLGVPHNAWFRGAQEGIATVELNRLVTVRKKLSWPVFSHVVLQSYFQSSAQRGGTGKVGDEIKKARLPKRSFQTMLQGLRRWIARLEPAEGVKTVWADYARTHSYSDAQVEAKKRFVHDFASKVEPAVLWDLGCNTGDYSKTALDAGAKTVIGFDFDQNALDTAFDRSRTEDLSFLPLFLDAANPSPSQGWAAQERSGLMERSNAQGLLALAFVHHLAIARNIPLPAVIAWIVALAPQGVIEFVPKEDPMVQELLRYRKDIFVDYTEAAFFKHLSTCAALVQSERVSDSGRVLAWYSRS